MKPPHVYGYIHLQRVMDTRSRIPLAAPGSGIVFFIRIAVYIVLQERYRTIVRDDVHE